METDRTNTEADSVMFKENYSTIKESIDEMRRAYPDFKITEERDKGTLSHTAKAFLYEKKYNNFDAKFYIDMLPAQFAGANIYQGDKFQYSIATCSGEWRGRLKHLEKVVGELDEKGLNGIKSKFGSRIGKCNEGF